MIHISWFLWPPEWGGFVHPLEAMERDFRSTLSSLGMKDCGDGAWDIRVDIAFKLIRLWLILSDGQYQAMELQTKMVMSKRGMPQAVSVALRGGSSFRVNRQGSQATYRLEFDSFQKI